MPACAPLTGIQKTVYEMLLALIAIVLVQSLAAVEANLLSREKRGDDIKALCRDKDINLSTFEQLKQLAARVEYSKCARQPKMAIQKLAKIYEEYKGDICSISHMEKFGEYCVRFVHIEMWPGKMPHSLRRFAIAYGLQVSKLCKRNMLEALTGEQGQRKLEAMGEEAGELFNQLTSAKGPVRRVLGNLCNKDEPLMPGDLNDFMMLNGRFELPIRLSKVRLSVTAITFIEKVKRQCEQNYRPAYGPFMLPLVELANLGLNYRDQELESELNDHTASPEIGRWSQIVFMCESLARIKFEHLSQSSSISEKSSENPSYESPVKVTLDEQTRVFDKTNEKLAEAIESTEFNPYKWRRVAQKVARMAAEAKVKSNELKSLDNLMHDLSAGLIQVGGQEGSTQILLEALSNYALNHRESS